MADSTDSVLFVTDEARIVQAGQVVRAETRPRLDLPAITLAFAAAILLTSLAFGGAWWVQTPLAATGDFVSGLVAVVAGLFGGLGLAAVAVAKMLPRRLEIDTETGRCRLSHLPGLSRSIASGSVQRLEVGSGRRGLITVGWVGLVVAGEVRVELLRLAWLGRVDQNQLEGLRLFAGELARAIGTSVQDLSVDRESE